MDSAHEDDFDDYNDDFDEDDNIVKQTGFENSSIQSYDPKTRVLGPSIEKKKPKPEGTSVHERKELRKPSEHLSYKLKQAVTPNTGSRCLSAESDDFSAKSYQINPTSKHSSHAALDHDAHLEHIAKLQKANHALRKQLVIFSRALESSLQVSRIKIEKDNEPNPSSGRTTKITRVSDDGKKSLRAIIASKDKALLSLKKKLDACKKSNDNLKKKVQKAYTSERVIQMGNEKKEKDLQIQQLLEETRNLRNIQRNQAKRLDKNKVNEEWPSRVSALQEELRLLRERFRRVKEKAKLNSEQHKKKHEQTIKLIEKNKEMAKEIQRYEAANGKAKTKETLQLEEMEFKRKEEMEKLLRKITIFEKSNKQEKIKLIQCEKKAAQTIEEKERKIKELKSRIEEKEKDMRAQVLQVKKLKRNLRELAMADSPLPSTCAPWSLNIAAYFTGEESPFSIGENNRKEDKVPYPSPPQTSEKTSSRSPLTDRTQTSRECKENHTHILDGQSRFAHTSCKRTNNDTAASNPPSFFSKEDSETTQDNREKNQKEESIQSFRNDEHGAATKLQALHRGNTSRRRAKELMQTRASEKETRTLEKTEIIKEEKKATKAAQQKSAFAKPATVRKKKRVF